MSLKDRAEKSKIENQAKFAIPNGNYLAKIFDWEKTKTLKTNTDQFVIKWKLLKVLEKGDKADPIWDAFEVKGKKIETDRYGLDEDWKWTPLYDMLEKAGYNVAVCEEPIEMENILEELEDDGFIKCEIKVTNKQNKNGGMSKNITVLEVMPNKVEEPVELEDPEDDDDDDDDDDAPSPKAKKSIRAPRRN